MLNSKHCCGFLLVCWKYNVHGSKENTSVKHFFPGEGPFKHKYSGYFILLFHVNCQFSFVAPSNSGKQKRRRGSIA